MNMNRYNCPSCGKFTGTTFCRYCGEPTESIWKYRFLNLVGLIILPLIIYFCLNEIIKTIPLIDSQYVDIINLMVGFSLLIGGIVFIYICINWIDKEIEFREYHKKKKLVN